MIRHLEIVVTMLTVTCALACAQQANTRTLGWDLTYQSVLDANGVGPAEWIREWLGPNYQSPVKQLIVNWKGEPIQSSILIEYPAPHAGEQITQWFVRTKNGGYYYERVAGNPLDKDNNPPRETNERLDPQAYDKFFATVSTWQQAKPVKPEETPNGAIPGYNGFLSSYNSGNSRQMLLTSEDFAICDTKKCETWKPGRLAEALQIIPRFRDE